jgi:lipoteichoic acid synthase
MKSATGGARYWLIWGLLLWTGRALLLGWLYFVPAPDGGPIVENWTRFLPHSLVAEAGVIALFTVLAMCGDRLLGRFCKGVPRMRRIWAWVATVFGILYLVAAHFDAELMRWMGQHLTFTWMETYLGQGLDTEFTTRILGGAVVAFFAGFFLTVGVSLMLVCWTHYRVRQGASTTAPAVLLAPASWGAILLVAVLGFVGLTSQDWFAKSAMRWRRVQPVAWVLGNEIVYRFSHALPPRDYPEGIRWLIESSNPESSIPAAPEKYPFWKIEPQEDALFEAFRARPLAEKPDVVVLWIESLRGWTVDMRDSAACAQAPNLCGLAREGMFFPHTHSTGFPSVEGFSALHLGVWSHPSGVLLSDRATIRNRSLNDILGKAGYYRAALTAASPSFDNLTPWLDRWYDFWEYDAERHNDVRLADRFAGLLGEVPADKPLFALWMSTTTHVPFKLPEEFGPSPDDPAARYLRVVAFADSAVGLVLHSLRTGARHRPTLILVAGDHAIPNRPLNAGIDEDGAPSQGHTWTALWIAGPGIPQGEFRARPVSHVDIAPTVLEALGIRASNHFVGRSLLTTPASGDTTAASTCAEGTRVLTFRLGGMAAQRGACRRLLRLDDRDFLRSFRQVLNPTPAQRPSDRVDGYGGDARVPLEAGERAELDAMRRGGEAWRWVLDHDLLMP